MLNGYNGKILRVDLTNGYIEIEEPGEAFYRKYMGGSAIGLYYILREMPPEADSLGPDNVLTLCLSVVTGAPVSGQSRLMANAKSPVTGAIGDSQAGGFFPAELKFAGFDGIIIKGKAARPVYLWIHGGQAELRDAAHLWGRITGEVQAAIRQELGDPKIEVAQIGPAAEKGVRFSAIMNNCTRANGRTGMGAVMASKNLKAIAVRGHQRLQVADPEGLSALAKWGAANIEQNPDMQGLAVYGTASVLGYQNASGGLPTRNYSSGVFEEYEKITGETMADTILKERDTCYACAVRCKRVVEINDPDLQVDPSYGGPEYETISTLGSYCGIGDLKAIAKANEICSKYGMDTISCGATVAFAMDCYENGILTKADTGGLDLRFGNAKAMVELVQQIAERSTPLGRLLSEGSARAAAKIGKGAENLVVAVKNHEVPAHMPQVKRSLAIIYAVNPFGADHQSHEHDPAYEEGASQVFIDRLAELDLKALQAPQSLGPEKIRFALYTQIIYSALDTLGLCQFVFGPAWQVYGPSHIVDVVRKVTGWNVSLWEIMKVGERRLNMLRAFNAREGIDRRADKLPKKFFEPLTGGASDGIALGKKEIKRALDTYFAMAGWDVETGVPTRQKLEELGLEWVADAIEV